MCQRFGRPRAIREADALNAAQRTIRRIDRFQQRHTLLGFPFAVLKKFGDDDAGGLAANISYYGFFSMFPLLLVFVSVLDLVLAGDPGLRARIVDSALGQFPVIGDQIANQARVHALSGSWVGIIVAGVAALWAGLGVAQSAEKAMNIVWDIPRAEWPNFVLRRVRAVLMLTILGTTVVITTIVSGFVSSGALPSSLLSVLGWAISIVLNFGLFLLTYQVLTARDLRWRNVAPGAAVAAVAWTALQVVGGYYLTHEVRSASNVYGTFALVIGLLIWIALGAQLTLLCAEINVVLHRRLWPRSLIQPPLLRGDLIVYRSIAERARMRPEVRVHAWVDGHEPGPRAEAGMGETTRATVVVRDQEGPDGPAE